MAKAAVDIGSNSVRLLLVDDVGGEVRLQQVTGLGRGVEATGRLSEESIGTTIDVLSDYRRRAEAVGAPVWAVATSASRDARNTEEFLERAQRALGARPVVISGTEEARLSHLGATRLRSGDEVVVDIGGGSTEVVYRDPDIRAVSVDMGSVRLTDRLLPNRPASADEMAQAAAVAAEALAVVSVPPDRDVVGVAGTWNTVADLVTGTPDSGATTPSVTFAEVDDLVGLLGRLTIAETEVLPGMHAPRAPVILGGSIVARAVMSTLGVDRVTVEVHDLLDGVLAET